ncbi:hypothetical protein [Kribbella endophytica]
MFMPTSPVIDAARNQSRSALPDAPVVFETPRRRPVVRHAAARFLAAVAVRIDPAVRPVLLES